MEGEYDTVFWIKFGILSLVLGIPIFIYTDGFKWKILFALATPIGIFLALSGKAIGKSHGMGGGFGN